MLYGHCEKKNCYYYKNVEKHKYADDLQMQIFLQSASMPFQHLGMRQFFFFLMGSK